MSRLLASYLYIFPHPDDESFGPALPIARQRRQGHDVSLLTLTRGEATTQRERLGFTKEKMGAVRYQEMQNVAEVLDLTDLTVLDFPDGGLDDLDPLELETAISQHVQQIRPNVVITYAVHGISGHPDHVVAHSIVKHVFCALRAQATTFLKRLAFFTLSEAGGTGRPDHLKSSPPEAIDCIVPFDEEDRRQAEAALDCYETYQEVIERHRPLDHVGDGICFELFQEAFSPPLEDLVDQLPEEAGRDS